MFIGSKLMLVDRSENCQNHKILPPPHLRRVYIMATSWTLTRQFFNIRIAKFWHAAFFLTVYKNEGNSDEICVFLDEGGSKERLCSLRILFLKEKIGWVGATTTKVGDKMRLETVKGYQYANI